MGIADHKLEKYQQGTLPEIFQLIGLLEKKLKHFQGFSLKTSGLTPPQYYILKLLFKENELPSKDLAIALSCTRATITGIVDTLEKKGLVKRVPNPGDRRSMLVQMTGKGRSLLLSTPDMGESFADCCDLLQPDESRELSRLLTMLMNRLNFLEKTKC